MAEPCAIIGLDLINALGIGPDAVWDEMMAYTCGIRPLKRFDHGRYRSDMAAEIPGPLLAQLRDEAGEGHFSLTYSIARRAAHGALKSAFGEQRSTTPRRVGLVLATTKGDLPEFERQVQNREGPAKGLYNPYLLALELARDLKLEGPVLAVSGACATGLLAMIHAVRLVQRGGAEAVVAVGVDVLSDFVLSGFSSVGAMAPEPCRPYDEKRKGLSLGEGAGAVVLVPRGTYPQKELALVSGWGVANDARHITAPSPTANGLIQALRQTMAMACLEVDEVHYLNAHGTGTIYNDAMEARAIHQVFGESPPPVSSMKGYFGHTLGAAGIIEAALTVVALRRKTVPASLGLEHPGADIPIQPVATHLHRPPLTHALTIKSGFGGINVALSLSALPSL